MTPIALSLVFECLWTAFRQSNLPALLSWEPSGQSGLKLGRTPWRSCKFSPWALVLGWPMLVCTYIVLLLYIATFWIPFGVQWSILHCSDTFHLTTFIKWLLLIIIIVIWFLFVILILERYSKYFDPWIGHIIYNFKSINIIHHKTRLLLSQYKALRRAITMIL